MHLYNTCTHGRLYIGDTGCQISTRVLEHPRNTRLGNLWSTVAEHTTETKCGIEFDRMETLANIHTYHHHIIRVAIERVKTGHELQPWGCLVTK